MARFDLSDAEWALIKPLLPDKPRGTASPTDRGGNCCGRAIAAKEARKSGCLSFDQRARPEPGNAQF